MIFEIVVISYTLAIIILAIWALCNYLDARILVSGKDYYGRTEYKKDPDINLHKYLKWCVRAHKRSYAWFALFHMASAITTMVWLLLGPFTIVVPLVLGFFAVSFYALLTVQIVLLIAFLLSMCLLAVVRLLSFFAIPNKVIDAPIILVEQIDIKLAEWAKEKK